MATKPDFEQMCQECPEVQLFLAIDGIGGLLWQMEHDLADGRMQETPNTESDLANLRQTVEIAVGYTTRFGVQKPRTDEGGPSTEYWKWYNWWATYVRGLSNSKFRRLNQMLERKESVESWRPTGDWRE